MLSGMTVNEAQQLSDYRKTNTSHALARAWCLLDAQLAEEIGIEVFQCGEFACFGRIHNGASRRVDSQSLAGGWLRGFLFNPARA